MGAQAGAPAPGPVPVVVMGLGYIGQQIAKAAAMSPETELIGAVDRSPGTVGREMSSVLGIPAGAFRVQPNVAAAVGRRRGAVLLHATGSRIAQVRGEVLEAIAHGMHVVSTCEELAFPWLNHPEAAAVIERAASEAGTSVVATGVNPGFVLDRLLATLGQVCGPVRRAFARRVVDTRTRRVALQRRVGAGLTEAEFFRLVDSDGVGHVGLTESAALAALGLGLDCDSYEEELLPVVAEEDISGGAFVVKKGRVAGIRQVAVGLADGQERVRLELTLAMGAENPADHLEIEADQRITLLIPGGVAGDRATANAVVNAAPRVTAAEPGLLTVLELPAGR